MFSALTDSFKTAINKMRFADDEKSLKKALDALKKSLLKADVHHKVVKELLKSVEKDTKTKGIGKESFLLALKNNLTDLLSVSGAKQGFVFASKPPTKVLMCGLQGSGKTTTTVKLANYLKGKKKKVLVAACDLQRMAAVEQLKQLCSANDIDLYFDEEKSPVEVAKDSLKKANDGLYDVLLIDTAGRLAIDEELMDELNQIKDAINPDEVFYVADSMTGQDAVRSASSFNERLNITGVILSKYDGDTKGGVALGIASQIGIPLRFIGVGEKVPDLEIFVPDRVVNRLMDEGDLEGLAEKTADLIDEKQAKKITSKIKKGEFNFNDFLAQLESMKKLGSMKSLVGMIPGMSGMAKQLENVDLDNSEEINKIKAMISSMTKKERENPKLLNNSRKRRIAGGAGLSQMEVNRFIKQFNNAAKVAKKFSGKKGMKDLQNLMAQAGSMKGIPR